jgi:ABC-type Zn uptake system ZnuABC Zn-binding protein ZnuA
MRARILAFVSILHAFAVAGPSSADPLRVAATTTDLANLVETVGGDDVQVTAFVGGGQDPHFVEARPSFIKELSRTDLFVTVGLQLEIGWVPPLLRNARNSSIQPGGPGALDASATIPLRGVLTGVVDRSMGDVHPTGNPHYLLDPVNGIRVAREIRDALARLRPEQASVFAARTASFEAHLLARLVGDEAVARHSAETLASAVLEERLADVVPDDALGGWLGAMRPHRGKAVVADHDLWPYFARRFGIEVAGFLEPLPGVTPTTRHLGEIASLMQRRGIRAILSAAYFSPRYAQKVAEATGGQVLEMANQVGARDGIDDYLAMVDWNVGHVAGAL